MMRMDIHLLRRFGLLLVGLAFASSTWAQQSATRMTLDQAIAYAMEHNFKLIRARLDVEDARQQVIETTAIGLPQINGGVDYNYYIELPTSLVPAKFFDPTAPEGTFAELQFGTKHNLTLKAQLSTLVFDGSYLVGLQAARKYAVLAAQQYVAAQAEVRNSVRDAYLPALIVRRNVEILDKNIATLQGMLEETRAMYAQGFVERLDVDRLELSLAQLTNQRDNLARQLETALNYLKFQMGYPLDQPLDIADDIETLLADGVPEEWLTGPIDPSQRPEYQAAQTGVELNELNIRRYQAGYLPSLAAFGSYQRQLQGNKLSDGSWFPVAIVGAQLNVPIFDGLSKKAKIQRAKIDLEQARSQTKELARAIQLEVANARTNYLSARERVATSRSNMELAERIYETTRIKYREGVGSSLELTQAEQALYQAQQAYTQALYDMLVAKTALMKALGK
ncbi:MAG: TolC family protein [Bacteroidetes bacterium]|nr:MAG: TolC family protein [Bacteroidota bacterium]